MCPVICQVRHPGVRVLDFSGLTSQAVMKLCSNSIRRQMIKFNR